MEIIGLIAVVIIVSVLMGAIYLACVIASEKLAKLARRGVAKAGVQGKKLEILTVVFQALVFFGLLTLVSTLLEASFPEVSDEVFEG